jgi:hypothetical protein
MRFDLTEIKLVDAQAAHQERKQSRCQFAFAVRGDRAKVAHKRRRHLPHAALGTDLGLGFDNSAALGAESFVGSICGASVIQVLKK